MEKILFVTRAHLLNTKSIDFACYIAHLTQSKLSGVFVEADMPKTAAPVELKGSHFDEVTEDPGTTDVITSADKSMRHFMLQCGSKAVHSEVYCHSGNPVEEVVDGSRYADLLILGSEMLLNPHDNEVPIPFVKHVLSKAECPVIIAPKEYNPVDEIIFCYDGSASSVFAAEQFTYLIPQFGSKKATLLEIKDSTKPSLNKGHDKTLLWLKEHYRSVHSQLLQGDPTIKCTQIKRNLSKIGC